MLDAFAVLLPDWFVGKDALTYATWALVGATMMLVLTGAIAIVFAWYQLGQERKQGRVENLERQLDTFEGDRYRKVRAQLAKARIGRGRLLHLDPSDPPAEVYEILDFFEHIGLLVREGNLSKFGVWHSFGLWIGAVCSDFDEVIAVEQMANPTTYCDIKRLLDALVRIEKSEGGDLLEYDTEELEAYYSYEATLAESNPGNRSRPRKKSPKPKQQELPNAGGE